MFQYHLKLIIFINILKLFKLFAFMSFIDNINNIFEDNICQDIYSDISLLTDITKLESDIITLYKNNKYDNTNNDIIDKIFEEINEKYKDNKNINFTKIKKDVKEEYEKIAEYNNQKYINIIKIHNYIIENT